MAKEIWKDIQEFNGEYQASNLGRIRSTDRIRKNRFSTKLWPSKVLTQSKNRRGYPCVMIRFNFKSHTSTVHRLVAGAFIPNPENLPTVNHIDGNKENNLVSNLEWLSNTDNIRHSWELGLRKAIVGEKNKNNIPVNQVGRDGMLIKKWISVAEAQRTLGIQHSNIYKVLSGERISAGGYLWQR